MVGFLRTNHAWLVRMETSGMVAGAPKTHVVAWVEISTTYDVLPDRGGVGNKVQEP